MVSRQAFRLREPGAPHRGLAAAPCLPRFGVLVLALAAALRVPAGAEVAPPSEDLWSGPAREAQRVVVVNEHGDVRVVAAPAGELLGIRGAASAARIEASSAAGGTVLTVRPLAPLEAGFAADIEVRVPAGVGLSVRTGAGAVTVAGVAALAGREAGDAVLDIETASGEVVFWVDPASDVAVEVATSGELAVDYSVTVELRHHQEPAKHARVVLGEGGPRWRATSRLGKVSVLRADRGHREPE